MAKHHRPPFLRWFIILCVVIMILAVFAPFVTYVFTSTQQ